MPPVSPAATTGARGGVRRQIAACRANRRLRRSAGSAAPSAARMPGQAFGRISRNLRTICQCSARSSGASLASRAKLAPSLATVSSRRARAAAECGGLARQQVALPFPPPFRHQPGQQQPAAQFRDRRRDRQIAALRGIFDGGELIRLEVADRPQPRQQQRSPGLPSVGCGAQKRLAQRPHRAPRRQQHRNPRQYQRIAAGERQQSLGQGRQKRALGRYRVELGCTENF